MTCINLEKQNIQRHLNSNNNLQHLKNKKIKLEKLYQNTIIEYDKKKNTIE